MKNLEHNSEWENYTISFIGETNAGKSTIIEALRIICKEQSKINEHIVNESLLSEEKFLLSKLESQQIVFDVEKERINEFKKKELEMYLSKAKDTKNTLLFKVRKFLQKGYSPFHKEIATLEEEIQNNLNRKFEELAWVIDDSKRLSELKPQIKYDGEIIGDGRLDFTQKNKTFTIGINKESIRIIDVPGIEGNEQEFEDEIKKAVSESHCVFYVSSSSKTLESGTLVKVKKYLKDQADVFAILNLRLNLYRKEFENQSFKEIFKNKLESIGSISEQLQNELTDNFLSVIPLNGHWGFLGLAKYLNQDRLKKDKAKLSELFPNVDLILEKSNFSNLRAIIFELIEEKENKIYRVNTLKINTLISSLIVNLGESLEHYLSQKFINDISEQAETIKRELKTIHSDYNRNLEGIRKRLLNNFKNEIYKKISEFVENNEIDKKNYNTALEEIVNYKQPILQQSIDENVSEATNRMNKQIERCVAKFLDRLSTLSKMNPTSFSNTKIDLKFVRVDISRLKNVIFSIGGFATLGFNLGAFFPVLGNLVGAISGAILGAVLVAIKYFFLSSEKKKSKILQQIDTKLSEQLKIMDKHLEGEFKKMSDEIKQTRIDYSISLVDDIVTMYSLRQAKITEIIGELENIKIKS